MSEEMLELAMYAHAQHVCCIARQAPICFPRFTVDGLHEELVWPLPPHQVAALRTLYSHGPLIVIPRRNIHFGQRRRHRSEYDAAINGIYPWISATFALQKLTIDTVGDGAAWTHKAMYEDDFGTTVHVLPSDAAGGAVTVSYQDRSTTWNSVDDCVLGFFNDCAVHVAPISSGARATLVFGTSPRPTEQRDTNADKEPCPFDDDDDDDEEVPRETPRKVVPQAVPTRTQMCDAVAAVDDHASIALDLCVRYLGASSSMEVVTGHVRDTIEFLVSTGVLDVALFHPNGPDDVDFHPGCNTPASVVAAATRTRLVAFASRFKEFAPDTDAIDIVFWPKTHRVFFLGLTTMISTLTAYVEGVSTDLVGFATLRELMSATIGMLRHHFCAEYELAVTPNDWAKLGAFILHHGDLDLAMDLLSKTTDARFWTMPTIVCDWFRALVTRYGWHVVLPSFRRDIQRCKSDDCAIFMHLLARLIEDNRLCVRQRHATEFLRAALHLFLKRQSAAGHTPYLDTFLTDALHVHVCLAAESADPLVGGVLAQRLPPPLLAVIDSFQPLVWSLMSALQLSEKLLNALSSVLMALSPLSRPLQPFVDIAVDSYCEAQRSIDNESCVALLRLTLGTPSFEAVFDTALRRKTMGSQDWVTLLTTPGLQLDASQAARLVATLLLEYRTTWHDDIADVEDLTDTAERAQNAVRVFARLHHAPGLARMVEYAYELEAAHSVPITLMMDVMLPLHDAFVDTGHLDGARALAAHCLPRLTRRLARLQAPANSRAPSDEWQSWRWCARHSDKVGAFAESNERATFYLDGSCNWTSRAIKKGRVPLRRYPYHVDDVCVVGYQAYPKTYTLVNYTDTIVAKMRDGTARFQRSLGELTAPSSVQCLEPYAI